MAEFVIDSVDNQTEAAFLKYRAKRVQVQQLAGDMYTAIARCERGYVELSDMLAGELKGLAGYHEAVSAPVADAVALLRDSMAGVMALMEQIQAAMPEGVELFPGVPR